MLRLIQQYLVNQGYGEVATQLEKESSVSMEDALVHEFRSQVLRGDFSTAHIERLGIGEPEAKAINYYLYEQQYLELMERGDKIEAIQVLQRELVPRTTDQQRLHALAQLIMCNNELVTTTTTINTNHNNDTANNHSGGNSSATSELRE
jgi:hypothetical protein